MQVQVAAAIAVLAAFGSAPQEEQTQNSYLGKAPPEFQSDKEHWFTKKKVEVLIKAELAKVKKEDLPKDK